MKLKIKKEEKEIAIVKSVPCGSDNYLLSIFTWTTLLESLSPLPKAFPPKESFTKP